MKNHIIALALALATLTCRAEEIPSYVNTDANVIEMNNGDWSALKQRFASRLVGDTAVIRVLHIGDSHIQAEFVTNRLRELLQQRYGNAGRGLISPLRLAGTNQPNDYDVTSPSTAWEQTRLLKYPWPNYPGVTGIAAHATQPTTVTWRARGEGHKIKNARFITSNGVSSIRLSSLADSVVTTVSAGESVFGAILDNGQPGVLYSAIGNNGACFTDYLLLRDFARDTRLFAPDLIILSMGTNEGFSTMTDEEITRSVHDLVNLLRTNNPSSAMLILLPMECQKNRRHGQKPLSPYYDINVRVRQAKDLINNAARELNVPVWNFYDVAGGDGASDRWLEDKLMNKDHIHLLSAGYRLEAQLLYDALIKSLD